MLWNYPDICRQAVAGISKGPPISQPLIWIPHLAREQYITTYLTHMAIIGWSKLNLYVLQTPYVKRMLQMYPIVANGFCKWLMSCITVLAKTNAGLSKHKLGSVTFAISAASELTLVDIRQNLHGNSFVQSWFFYQTSLSSFLFPDDIWCQENASNASNCCKWLL